MRVFITGADGFIGSHLAERWAQSGAAVTALVQYNSMGSHGCLAGSLYEKDIEFCAGDIRDLGQMETLINEGHAPFDLVFHLAALISVPYSSEAPQSFIDTNVTGTLNILGASRNAGKIIHTSTSEVYGSSQTAMMDETHPIVPQSAYAASKVGADALVQAAWRQGLPVTTIRPFNTYGPRQSERALIGSVVRQTLDPKCNRVTVGSVVPIRDWTYISDMIWAFTAVAAHGKVGEVYNAASGQALSVQQMIQAVFDKAAPKVVSSDEERIRPDLMEVDELVGDAGKLHRISGWEPKCSLGTGLRHTMDWWSRGIEGLSEVRYAV
jgi:nucleoside-diphosphate-sugar epimerase